jgi:predicted negative regulator of RcsB-dependent stress response
MITGFILITIAAALSFKYMMILQKRKEEEAERRYQQVMERISIRNKRIDR